MRPIRPADTSAKARRAWEAPAFTKLAIGAETKAAQDDGARAAEPQSPAAPASKLGFSFEMAFPMSSRWE